MRRKEDRIRVVLCRPGEPAQETWVENSREGIEKAIGGPQQEVFRRGTIYDGVVLIINKDAISKEWWMDKAESKAVMRFSCGDFLVAGYQGGELKSLTPEKAFELSHWFSPHGRKEGGPK